MKRIKRDMEPRITQCRILPRRTERDLRGYDSMAAYQGEDQSTVIAEMTDGTTNIVFRYFDDEISFKADEFVGMTQFEALNLFHTRDIEYLRS